MLVVLFCSFAKKETLKQVAVSTMRSYLLVFSCKYWLIFLKFEISK